MWVAFQEWKNIGVMGGKYYNLNEVEDEGWPVKSLIINEERMSLFNIREPMYPRLVRVVYASSYQAKGENDAWPLKGQFLTTDVLVNLEGWAVYLNLPNEGLQLFHNNSFELVGTSRKDVVTHFIGKNNVDVKSKDLPPMVRFIYNVLPCHYAQRRRDCCKSNRSKSFGFVLSGDGKTEEARLDLSNCKVHDLHQKTHSLTYLWDVAHYNFI